MFKEALGELEDQDVGHGWLGGALRFLADGGQASEAFKSFIFVTSLFTLVYKSHQDPEKFVISKSSSDKILPTGNDSIDRKNLTFLIKRCDFYADKLSAEALHGGQIAHQARNYRRALKILEVLGYSENSNANNLLEKSSRISVSSFAMSVLYGIEWGGESGHLKPPGGDRGCSLGLVMFAVASMRLPMAKTFFSATGPLMNPEYNARAAQLIMKSSCFRIDKNDHSFERNFLIAPMVCPHLGMMQWRLKSKKGRDALRAFEIKSHKPPFDLTKEFETISSMVPSDNTDDDSESEGDTSDRDAEVDDHSPSGGGKDDEQELAENVPSLKDGGEKQKEASGLAGTKEASMKMNKGKELAKAHDQESSEKSKVETEKFEGRRPSTDYLRARPDKKLNRGRSRSPLGRPEYRGGERSPKIELDVPFYKENIKQDWSWSRIRKAQENVPGTCRRLPGQCKPWLSRDGRFKSCKFAHPWLVN